MLGLRVDVLGAPVVTVNGHPLVVDTRKAVAVLAVLALSASAGRPTVSRAELATLLWPEVDDSRARSALRRTLSVLIAAAGAGVVADRSSVTLAEASSDVVTFRLLAASADREDLARAVALVRGELLAGFTLRDSPVFEEWTARESDALRRELGSLLERLVLARLRHGELHAGLADAARWLELDPLHEAAHRSVMRLLAWTGRRQDAIDHYHRCVRVLGDELGVAPVRATTAVFEAIRRGTLAAPLRPSGPAPSTAAAVSARIAPPAADVPLIGREDALASLRATVGRGGRLVLVTGEGGVGRSRLVEIFAAALERVVLVRAHGGEGESGLPFAPIADLLRAAIALGPPLPDDLAAAVARLVPEARPAGRPVDPPLSTPGARDLFYDAVIRVLATSGADAVIVEDVHAAGPATAQLLAYVSHRLDRLGCPLVLTWRDPGLPERNPLARALGSGRAAARTTTIALARLTREQISQLCEATAVDLDADALWRDTAGLPLMVAASARAGAAANGLPVSVRDLLAARLGEVSEEATQVLAALAVLDGVADAGDLQGASGRTESETADAVEEALQAGLVREEGSAIAFTHDVLRRVAYDRLSMMRRRLLHHRAATTLAARRDADAHAATIARNFHLGGRDELAADWAWRAATGARELYAHAEALHNLELAASLGRDDAAAALARGEVLVAMGRYEDARESFDRASALGGPHAWRAGIERRRADVAVRLGEWARAADGLDAALELLGPADAGLRARLLADRAVVTLRAGSPGEADALSRQALEIAPAPDAYLHNILGIVALAAGCPVAATGAFGRALDIVARAPEPVLEAAIQNNLATSFAAAGQAEQAAATARAALTLGHRLGDRHRLAALHANLADRLHDLGDTAGAQEHLTQSATLFAEVSADPLDHPDLWTLTSW